MKLNSKVTEQLIRLSAYEKRSPDMEIEALIDERINTLTQFGAKLPTLADAKTWILSHVIEVNVQGPEKPEKTQMLSLDKKPADKRPEPKPAAKPKKRANAAGYRWTAAQRKRLSESMKLAYQMRKLKQNHPAIGEISSITAELASKGGGNAGN